MQAKPTNKDFARVANSAVRDLAKLAVRLRDGDLSPDEWGDAFQTALVNGHADSWLLGARRGGRDFEGIEELARRFGQHAADQEAEWLQNFINDLEDGRYLDDEGNLRTSAVNARSRLYVGKMRGTANQSFLDAGGLNQEYDWLMTGLEHCGDCPRLAALSPYRAEELFTVPGQGDTECLGNCTCILVRLSDGVRGFANPFF
jgi:hypothetical protein